MFTRDQAARLAEKILSLSSFPECSVTLGSEENLNLRFANNGITTSGFAVERSVIVSSTRDARTGAASTDQIDDTSLRAAVKRSEELAALAPENPEYMPPLGKQEYPPLDHYDEQTAQARSPVLVPHVRAIIDKARESKLVAAGFFERSARGAAIANKNGLFHYQRSTDARLSTTVRAADGSSSGWAAWPSVRIGEIDGAVLAGRAIEKCLRWRNPVRLDPGKYTVLLEANAVGDLLRSMTFSFSARAAEEGRSFLSKKGGGTLLGEKLFPEVVSVRSDPFDPRLPAAAFPDPLPARKTVWVERGVVRNLYYDRYWAKKAGKEPTPSPGSLVLDGGDASLEDLVKSVDRGLLVTHFWYIRPVNPRTLQLTGLTRDGLFLIENGKLVTPVVNFRFNESPVRLLENVRQLGRPIRTQSFEGGSMVAPPLVAADFTFSSISDAV